ncbi:hypothetical protein [Kordiimonas sp.]|uniref:hypothetical protein n=1 Tax=Kordiimonas sp. TaxID=1970157 RepID=UPI003A91B92A
MNETDLPEYLRNVYHYTCSYGREFTNLEHLFTVGNWNLNALIERANPRGFGWAMKHDELLSKPRIALICDVTAQRNLSVSWEPYKDSDGLTDWCHWFRCTHQPFDRPLNELWYVRSCGLLNPDTGVLPNLNGAFMALIIARYRSLTELLENTFEVIKVSDFDVELKLLSNGPKDFLPAQKIISWNLYDVAERHQEIEQAWLESFEEVYKVSPSLLLSIYAECLKPKRRKGNNRNEYTSTDLKKIGVKMTPGTVRKVVDRLSASFEHLLVDAGVNDPPSNIDQPNVLPFKTPSK